MSKDNLFYDDDRELLELLLSKGLSDAELEQEYGFIAVQVGSSDEIEQALATIKQMRSEVLRLTEQLEKNMARCLKTARK